MGCCGSDDAKKLAEASDPQKPFTPLPERIYLGASESLNPLADYGLKCVGPAAARDIFLKLQERKGPGLNANVVVLAIKGYPDFQTKLDTIPDLPKIDVLAVIDCGLTDLSKLPSGSDSSPGVSNVRVLDFRRNSKLDLTSLDFSKFPRCVKAFIGDCNVPDDVLASVKAKFPNINFVTKVDSDSRKSKAKAAARAAAAAVGKKVDVPKNSKLASGDDPNPKLIELPPKIYFGTVDPLKDYDLQITASFPTLVDFFRETHEAWGKVKTQIVKKAKGFTVERMPPLPMMTTFGLIESGVTDLSGWDPRAVQSVVTLDLRRNDGLDLDTLTVSLPKCQVIYLTGCNVPQNKIAAAFERYLNMGQKIIFVTEGKPARAEPS